MDEDLIDYAFLPHTELINLTQEKECLQKELFEMQSQMKDLMQKKSEKHVNDSSLDTVQENSSIKNLLTPTVETKDSSEVTDKKENETLDDGVEEQKDANESVMSTTPKNINRSVLAKQLKEKLNEVDVDLPTNVEALVLGAVNTSKKT